MDFVVNKLWSLAEQNGPKVDFIGELPPEVGQIILSKLDTEGLLNAATVSRKWLSTCKSSNRLKFKVLRYLRTQRLISMFPPVSNLNSTLDVFTITVVMLFIIRYIRGLIFKSIK